MYTEKALDSFKNLWNKDEQTFIYCLDLLKNKMTELELYQFKFYYYLKNNIFEKAIECWYELRNNIELMGDDFWNEYEKYELNKANGEMCGSCCVDCCTSGNICSWLWVCASIPAGCGICYECCSSIGFSWNGGDWTCTNNCVCC